MSNPAHDESKIVSLSRTDIYTHNNRQFDYIIASSLVIRGRREI